MSTLLEISDLTSGYNDIVILKHVSFGISNDEFLGIFGHNGMGKSTLLKTIMGHIRCRSGSIRFAGEEISGLSVAQRARKGLGYVPQGRQIFPNLTVQENLKMAMLAVGPKRALSIKELLSYLPRLESILDRQGGVLSGGEQQILALGRCLISRPRLILLDEPTEGIQPSIRGEIIDVLLGLRKQWDLSMILVEQNMDFLKSLSDRIIVLQKGELTHDLDPANADLLSL